MLIVTGLKFTQKIIHNYWIPEIEAYIKEQEDLLVFPLIMGNMHYRLVVE